MHVYLSMLYIHGVKKYIPTPGRNTCGAGQLNIFKISLQGLNKHAGWLIGCPRLVWRGNLQGFGLVDYIFRLLNREAKRQLLNREAKRQAQHTQVANAGRWPCGGQAQVQSVGGWVQAQEGAGASALGAGAADIKLNS